MPKYVSKSRSTEIEIMDDFNLKGKKMQAVLTDLNTVSSLLGGANITLKGIKKLLIGSPKNKPITIIDVGGGDGEMLRKCARFGKKNRYNFKLIGLDANANIISEAKERSKNYENITFKTFDIFSMHPFPKGDIILCNLFLHHFKNAEIVTILKKVKQSSNIGVVVNDLQRSELAFNLFKAFGWVFLKTKIAKHDGLVSVARGFKREELEHFSEKINNQQSLILWKWAFRYQWILKNNV